MIPPTFIPALGRALLANWKLVLGGLAIAALAVMLLLAKADARHWHKLADQRQELLATERANHAVTRASVDRLMKAVESQNADIAARSRALDDAKRQAAADIAAADTRWKATEGQVSRLKAIAARPASGCAVPRDLAEALKGL